MAKAAANPVILPPPTAAQCWAEFLKWAVGVPLVGVGALVLIAGVLWLAGGQDLAWQATSSIGTALFWIAAIALMYPAMLVIWVLELRDGLHRARDWDAMTPEARALTPLEPKPRRGKAR